MKIILKRVGVHECGVDGIAGKALVYSCKFFWFFFNDCKKNIKKESLDFPDRVLWTADSPSLHHFHLYRSDSIFCPFIYVV